LFFQIKNSRNSIYSMYFWWKWNN